MCRRLSCGSAADLEERRGDEPYDSFKIISKRALADYHRAEARFIEFLDEADVWSLEQVRNSRLPCLRLGDLLPPSAAAAPPFSWRALHRARPCVLRGAPTC